MNITTIKPFLFMYAAEQCDRSDDVFPNPAKLEPESMIVQKRLYADIAKRIFNNETLIDAFLVRLKGLSKMIESGALNAHPNGLNSKGYTSVSPEFLYAASQANLGDTGAFYNDEIIALAKTYNDDFHPNIPNSFALKARIKAHGLVQEHSAEIAAGYIVIERFDGDDASNELFTAVREIIKRINNDYHLELEHTIASLISRLASMTEEDARMFLHDRHFRLSTQDNIEPLDYDDYDVGENVDLADYFADVIAARDNQVAKISIAPSDISNLLKRYAILRPELVEVLFGIYFQFNITRNVDPAELMDIIVSELFAIGADHLVNPIKDYFQKPHESSSTTKIEALMEMVASNPFMDEIEHLRDLQSLRPNSYTLILGHIGLVKREAWMAEMLLNLGVDTEEENIFYELGILNQEFANKTKHEMSGFNEKVKEFFTYEKLVKRQVH